MSKKLTAEQIEASAWAAALRSEFVADKVPEGWHTSRQLCQMLGKSDSRLLEMLRVAIDAGRCERKEFRIPAAGTVRPVPHYKLK